MRFALTLILGASIFQPSLSFANPCTDVVADTVAELRAGANGGWTEDMEGLVRAAAGSACVKAQSERYQTATPAMAGEGVVGLNAAPHVPVAQGLSADKAESDGAEASPEASPEGSAEENDDGWNIGGLTIRSMSGSPSQKPYERARQTKKDKEE